MTIGPLVLFFTEWIEVNGTIEDRWSISIGVSLHIYTDGDMFYCHLCRNINKPRFEGLEFTNTPTDQ